jgi:hypothetical protein
MNEIICSLEMLSRKLVLGVPSVASVISHLCHPCLSVVKKNIMKTRTSKIARLPKAIRDELNHKIEDGLLGVAMTDWLNNLPEVKQILAEHFNGRPITHQNISDWRRTGYADWQLDREGRQHWWEMIEAAHELNEARNLGEGKGAGSHLGTILLVELGQALNRLHATKNPKEHLRLLRLLSVALSRLRNDDTREKRLQLKQAQQPIRRSQISSNPACACIKKLKCVEAPNSSRLNA